MEWIIEHPFIVGLIIGTIISLFVNQKNKEGK